MPAWSYADYRKLRRMEEEHIKVSGQQPSLKKLAWMTGIKTDDILKLRRMHAEVSSLDRSFMGEDEDLSLADTIRDETDYYTRQM